MTVTFLALAYCLCARLDTPLWFPDHSRHHVVPCVLHFLMAIGRLLCAFILRTSPEKHKEAKDQPPNFRGG